jgi:hypothetical protein
LLNGSDEMALEEQDAGPCTLESCLQALIERMCARALSATATLEEFVLLAAKENVPLLIFTVRFLCIPFFSFPFPEFIFPLICLTPSVFS